MNREPDMVTAAENSVARFRDALDAQAQAAYQSLYSEFVTSLLKSPTCLIRTPGFSTQAMTVAEVIDDHFAGHSGDADQNEMFSIFAEVAKTNGALGDRARALLGSIADKHADFHAEDA